MKQFILCVVYLVVIGCSFFVVGRALPEFLFVDNKLPFRIYSFEKNGDVLTVSK